MDEEKREEFGQFLRDLREKGGMTQKDAAAQAGMSAPYLAQLERGQRNPPSRKILSRLAGVYGVAPQALWDKAHGSEAPTRAAITEADAERIEWAYQSMLRDPDYTFGTRVRGKDFTLEAKSMLVEIYQKSMNRQLLTPAELSRVEKEEDGGTGGDAE